MQQDASGMTRRDHARITLAGVRLFNGGTALAAAGPFARRLGTEADAHGPGVHISRMFGIRTVLIAIDLLSRDPDVRRHALRVALIVHVSDTISAAAAGLSKQMPPRAGRARDRSLGGERRARRDREQGRAQALREAGCFPGSRSRRPPSRHSRGTRYSGAERAKAALSASCWRIIRAAVPSERPSRSPSATPLWKA